MRSLKLGGKNLKKKGEEKPFSHMETLNLNKLLYESTIGALGEGGDGRSWGKTRMLLGVRT